MMRAGGALALAAALACLPAPGRAYVTSATLEYACDDLLAIWINGTQILDGSIKTFSPFDYAVLSTSDGTLPLEVFNANGDNVLAVENLDLEGGNMYTSYRLTVHQSDGDPIKIWSIPEQAKMLHLRFAQRSPLGWEQPSFDDSAWGRGVEVTATKSVYSAAPILPDKAFAGFAGMHAFVPFESSTFNAGGILTRDHNLFRSHFRFPEHPAQVQALLRPAQAAVGQQVAVRLVPGPDTSELSQFDVLAWLPQGLEPVSLSPGGAWDARLRRAHWSYGRRDMVVRFVKMGLQAAESAPGWKEVGRMLGLEKPGKLKRRQNTPDAVWNDGAVMSPVQAGWFKFAPAGVDLSRGRPQILGVIFHTQMRVGGFNTQNQTESDAVLLNYSVDGGERGALQDDVEVSRASINTYWFDGYYDASEDRHWTWEDIDRLRVKFQCRPRGNPDSNLIASCVVTVKCFNPSKASPWFYAKVTEPGCADLRLNAGLFRAGSALTSSDPVLLPVNRQLCAPTPAPTPTAMAVPKALLRAPTPEPTRDSGKAMASDVRFQLACVAANPEPFNYAGTFVSFCLKADADVTLNVYGSEDGKLVRQIKVGAMRPGDNQFFYNALDDSGALLRPGEYLFELVAEKDGHKETRNATFHMVSRK